VAFEEHMFIYLVSEGIVVKLATLEITLQGDKSNFEFFLSTRQIICDSTG
jgi:hypothetical protein